MGSRPSGISVRGGHHPLRYLLFSLAVFMLFVCFGPGQHRFPHSRYGFKLRGHSTKELPGYSSDDLVFTEAGNTLPNIPPRIWQFYTPLKPGGISSDFLASWSLRCPNYLHSVIDEAGSRALMSSLASMPGGRFRGALEIFDHLDRVVLRADLIRFVLLALRGGIYSDTDVEMVQPLSAWVPDEWKAHARLIVGLEADQEQPIPETTYPVQFATWTIAGAPGHPLFYHMIERILNNLRACPPGVHISDEDVLRITGPVSFTEAVFHYLGDVTGTTVTHKNLTGMRTPRLYGDALVLPIDGFATGVPHSGASQEIAQWTMVKHHFSGSWKKGE